MLEFHFFCNKTKVNSQNKKKHFLHHQLGGDSNVNEQPVKHLNIICLTEML